MKLKELQAKMGVCKTEKDAIIYIRPDFKAKCCPHCGKGKLQIIMSFRAHAPPFHYMLKMLTNNALECKN
jgi:hypothetical protein